MHSLGYALLPLEEANSSKEARNIVYDFLVNDASFMEDSNASYRFWSPICDWFVIGGRWSGALNSQNILDEYYKRADELPGDRVSFGKTLGFIAKNKEFLNKIWQELGGKYDGPSTRDQYKSHGYEDDARIIDEEIVEKIKKLEQSDTFGCEKILDCSSDNLYAGSNDYEALIGKAWAVIIDYHF